MDEITRALRQYEREKGEKKAVLLMPDGGYYLYGNRFCGISEYELSLSGEGLQVQGHSVPCGLFFGLAGDKLRWAVKENSQFSIERLSLIFHIALVDEDELLRGILFAQSNSAYLSLFIDPDIEQIYRAVSAAAQPQFPKVPPGEDLTAYAAECARNDLHSLTSLYLIGQKLSNFPKIGGSQE